MLVSVVILAGGSSWSQGLVGDGNVSGNSISSAVRNISAQEELSVKLLNADRLAHGLQPLAVNPILTTIAERHAQDMIDHMFFSHINLEGESPKDRVSRSGISFGYVGENLAIDITVEAAEAALMRSLAHRANILNSQYTEVGIGVREGSDGEIYMVQVFIGPGAQ